MNDFLRQISTRSDQPPRESILTWSGYIDEGKQMSILHHLLSESIQKLPPNRQTELGTLRNILDGITRSKNTNGTLSHASTSPLPLSQGSNSSINNSNNQESAYQANSISLIGGGDRGIIRGVLTPSSLERNIFRYNDPTVSILVNNLQTSTPNQSQTTNNQTNGAHHPHQSQYTSNSSLASGNNYHNYADSTSNQNQHPSQLNVAQYMQSAQGKARPQHQYHPHQHHLHNPILQQKTLNYSSDSLPMSPRNFNTLSNYHVSSSTSNVGARKTAVTRASTLPRNNNTIVNINRDTQNGDYAILEPPSSSDLIQIGVDTSSAFVRKSPTPMFKSAYGTNRSGPDSQLSSTNSSRSNDDQSPQFNNIRQYLNQQPTRISNPHGNMPMKIEDLDDLLNYADEQAACEARITSTERSGSFTNVARSPSPVDNDVFMATATGDLTSKIFNANNNNQHCSILQYMNGKYGNNNAVGNQTSNISNNNHYNASSNINNNNNNSESSAMNGDNTKYLNGLNAVTNVTAGLASHSLLLKNSKQPSDMAKAGANAKHADGKYNVRSSHKTASLTSSSSEEGVVGHNLNLMCCGVSNSRLAHNSQNGNGHNNLNGTLSSSSHGSNSEKDHLFIGNPVTNDYNNILINIGKSTRRLADIPGPNGRGNAILQVRSLNTIMQCKTDRSSLIFEFPLVQSKRCYGQLYTQHPALVTRKPKP